MERFNSIVIGGGPAGMICAGFLSKRNKKTLLIEKNDKVGKKLAITGKGRCNITNMSPCDNLIENIATNPFFLYSSFYSFPPEAVVDFFMENGLKTKVERGNRVFPESDKAADVVSCLGRFINNNNTAVLKSKTVKKILVGNNTVKGVLLSGGEEILADSVVLAAGGMSYPKTGSDGNGYRLAKDCGHTVIKPYPSLVPLLSANWFIPELAGLSLKNAGISVYESGSKLYGGFGEMLFTHTGVSGPVILSASRCLTKTDFKDAKIIIDLKPALSEKELDLRILRDFAKYCNKDYINALSDLLPNKLIPVICKLSGIDERKKVRDITKDERKRLLSAIKKLVVDISGTAGFNEAVITCGGVSVTEVDPGTMESKIVNGLYFAGEILDVDGYTGGYNLQIAFSTGFLAGNNA